TLARGVLTPPTISLEAIELTASECRIEQRLRLQQRGGQMTLRLSQVDHIVTVAETLPFIQTGEIRSRRGAERTAQSGDLHSLTGQQRHHLMSAHRISARSDDHPSEVAGRPGHRRF